MERGVEGEEVAERTDGEMNEGREGGRKDGRKGAGGGAGISLTGRSRTQIKTQVCLLLKARS